jgi:hypothetical protein
MLEQFLKSTEEKNYFVLKELTKGYVSQSRIGRRTLHGISIGNGIFISEQEIRFN